MESKEKELTFIQRVAAVQGALRAPKGQWNGFGKYAYRSCEDILEAVKPLLTRHGLVLTVGDEVEQTGDRIYIRATATLTDGERSLSNSALAREPLDKKGMDASQVTGMASSYARKYALNGLLCIDDAKDADAMDNRQGAAQAAAPAATVGQALAEVAAASSPQELTACWERWRDAFGQDPAFVKAIMDSPQNRPRG